MSGITVSEDAVNLYYFMKAKSNVSHLPQSLPIMRLATAEQPLYQSTEFGLTQLSQSACWSSLHNRRALFSKSSVFTRKLTLYHAAQYRWALWRINDAGNEVRGPRA